MTIFLESPQGDEIKEVEATAQTLTPLLVAGWRQVPAPAKHETMILANTKEGK
jgi:hypothetical protein